MKFVELRQGEFRIKKKKDYQNNNDNHKNVLLTENLDFNKRGLSVLLVSLYIS